MTTSSAPILYPTLKGLESSNSSFVQVSQPIKDVNRNSTSNHRNSASKTESKRYKSKQPKLHESVERCEDILIDRRQHWDHSNMVPILDDKEGDNHEPVNHYYETSDSDFKTGIKVEKQQQYNSKKSRTSTTDDDSNEKEKQYKEIADLSLMKPELVQGLIHKHPKHTIIINNTFINRSPTEQDEFLAKFSPTFYSQNPNVALVRDAVTTLNDNDRNQMKPLTDGVQEETSKTKADSDSPSSNVDELNIDRSDSNEKSPSIHESVPMGSIITAILWLVLILFWFLLYLKVVSVYHPLRKAAPKPMPTNFELCLMIMRKFGSFIMDLWRLW